MLENKDVILSGKRVALLGFGVENRALLPFLQSQGAHVTVIDKNTDLATELGELPHLLGNDYLEHLLDFDVIFRSPGIPYLTPQIQAARQAGVVISSQTQLFLSHCPAGVIGVTGTKGKSTTTALIHAILTRAKQNGEILGETFLTGNIGTPPISVVEKLTEKDWVCIELSSFQLQDVTVSPDIAVVLNITVDHLDHHRDEAEYISAKKNIVRYQQPSDFLVINQDSITSILFADETPAQALFYSRYTSVDQGCFVEHRLGEDQLILRLPNKDEEVVAPVSSIKLVGQYNHENVTAAITASSLAGASVNSIREALSDFTGLNHRLELVAEKFGVRYYDDSKSTTPDSTAAAILSFSQPITLILGGVTKGADYAELVEQIKSSTVRAIVLIGKSTPEMKQLLDDHQVSQAVVYGGSTMQEIVEQAAALSEEGGVVLLSPAAASFDMFNNAEDRGDQFKAAVAKL